MNINSKVQYPCKGCIKRSKPDEPNCHGYCKEYLSARHKADEINEQLYKAKQFRYAVDYNGRVV